MIRSFPLILVLSLAATLPVGCASTRIAAWEAMGYAKRDQLVEGVVKARDQQEETKKQFQSALEQFLAVTDAGKDTKVSELESRYKQLQSQYDRSESAAASVRSRISTVESVADALFREWQAELKQYSSDTMRQASQRQLDDTKAQYARLIDSMKSASAKMDPVLAAFKDQTLFLKHNLNARAIASLQQTSTQIQSDVSRLIGEMEASIAEANRFIDQMGQTN